MPAGTITGVLERFQTPQYRPSMCRITLTCTAGDGSVNTLYPATVLNTLAGISDYDLRGLKLYSVKIKPGAGNLAPTNLADLTITDTNGIDLLGGKGVDAVLAASVNWIAVGPEGAAMPALIMENLTINLSGNSVASAVVVLILELTGD